MSTTRRRAIANNQTQAQPNETAVTAALAVLDSFMAALNAGNEPALLATLHFPHYRLAGGRMRVWDQPGAYLGDFLSRAGADWHHSEWDFRKVIAAGEAKVHLEVQFTRYRGDKSVIGSFRSLWIVTKDGSSPELMAAGPWRRGRVSRIDLRDSRPRKAQFYRGRTSSGGCRNGPATPL
jgi:hypothetical protein